jgi:hypothetical protein
MISVLDLGGLDYSQQSKGNFLYSTMIANSTMDYLTKVIEDSVVNSLHSRGHVPLMVNSLLPLRVKTGAVVWILNSMVDSRSLKKFYNSPSSSIPKALVKVYFILQFFPKLVLCEQYMLIRFKIANIFYKLYC